MSKFLYLAKKIMKFGGPNVSSSFLLFSFRSFYYCAWQNLSAWLGRTAVVCHLYRIHIFMFAGDVNAFHPTTKFHFRYYFVSYLFLFTRTENRKSTKTSSGFWVDNGDKHQANERRQRDHIQVSVAVHSASSIIPRNYLIWRRSSSEEQKNKLYEELFTKIKKNNNRQ